MWTIPLPPHNHVIISILVKFKHSSSPSRQTKIILSIFCTTFYLPIMWTKLKSLYEYSIKYEKWIWTILTQIDCIPQSHSIAVPEKRKTKMLSKCLQFYGEREKKWFQNWLFDGHRCRHITTSSFTWTINEKNCQMFYAMHLLSKQQ